MSTTTFRRHHLVSLDAAIHRVYSKLSSRTLDAFTDLLCAVRARSNLMAAAPVRVDGALRFVQLDALRNLARFHHRALRFADTWEGAHGHPLAVIDSLARHLHARYPTPRFMASVWFGDHGRLLDQQRAWVLAHAAGTRVRSLGLPMVMTRRMEHLFLRTPAHLTFDVALRRAEVLGLGGSLELAAQVVATRLVRDFSAGAYWRNVLAWLVRCEEQLAPGDVALLVEHLEAIRTTAPSFDGRTVASVKRDDAVRRCPPRPHRVYTHVPPMPRVPLVWPKSQWADVRCGEWNIVELLCSEDLAAEGRRLHHCVGRYDYRCHQRSSTIWSMRRADGDEPVLTIEVDPREGAIVMVRGTCNRTGNDDELAAVSSWAARMGLVAAGSYARDLAARASQPRAA